MPLSEDPQGWTLPDVVAVLTALWSPRTLSDTDAVPLLRNRISFLFDLTERRLRARPDVSSRLPQELLDRSRDHALALAAGGPVGLVHGDLHPGNVLRTGRGAVAIDPRPCLGDPAFDAVDWILVGAVGRQDVGQRIAWLDLAAGPAHSLATETRTPPGAGG